MQEIKRFQVRGVPGEVVRVQFGSRIVDYWIPKGGTDRLLIAHDGQNVFDGKKCFYKLVFKKIQKYQNYIFDIFNEVRISSLKNRKFGKNNKKLAWAIFFVFPNFLFFGIFLSQVKNNMPTFFGQICDIHSLSTASVISLVISYNENLSQSNFWPKQVQNFAKY